MLIFQHFKAAFGAIGVRKVKTNFKIGFSLLKIGYIRFCQKIKICVLVLKLNESTFYHFLIAILNTCNSPKIIFFVLPEYDRKKIKISPIKKLLWPYQAFQP